MKEKARLLINILFIHTNYIYAYYSYGLACICYVCVCVCLVCVLLVGILYICSSMMDVLVVDYNKWNTVQFFLELSPTVLYHMNTLL